eukprot:746540-Hanusia_phi.AAC.3
MSISPWPLFLLLYLDGADQAKLSPDCSTCAPGAPAQRKQERRGAKTKSIDKGQQGAAGAGGSRSRGQGCTCIRPIETAGGSIHRRSVRAKVMSENG